MIKKLKSLEEIYPTLRWDKSYEGLIVVQQSEDESIRHLLMKYKLYIKSWEYTYYYLTLIIQQSNIEKSYGTLASLYTEAYSSLRCSFLSNIRGYHPDALSLMRRVHESIIKMIAIKVYPKDMWKIVSDSSIQGPESKLKLKFKWINTVESSFLHSNKIKVFKIGKDIIDNNEFSISYGPQKNDLEFQTAANLSIFWMYILTLVAPRIFPDQLPVHILQNNDESCKVLLDFLKTQPNKDELFKSGMQVRNILDKIGPVSHRNQGD